ncbi:MAG: methylenetetrahydrofolate reductase [Pseudarcicella sp.]|nr:methylenetetrahydrofolate reductase [Pseudarcicella sp.]MBP6410384.1 methylenetetrahydrofolate reductase [Pseudarcicella sp.]
MTKITQYIAEAAGKTQFSIEIIPPVKGADINTLMTNIEPLMEFKPPFIEVTYHREEYIEKNINGIIEKIPTRKRPGTVGICSALMQRFKVDAVPHVICGGFTKEETEDFLYDLHYLGIDNLLILRGDPIKGSINFTPEKGGHAYASELLEQVVNMNKGILLHEETEASPTNFCTGVAAYPEKHFEAIDFETDFGFLKKKIDAGADYIVTQMFFDNQKYFDFVKKCRENNIHVPIIPGLKPLATIKQLTVLPEIFHLSLPEALTKAVKNCKTDKDVKEVGIEWCIAQSKELIVAQAPILHFYTMSRSESTKRVAEAVF